MPVGWALNAEAECCWSSSRAAFFFRLGLHFQTRPSQSSQRNVMQCTMRGQLTPKTLTYMELNPSMTTAMSHPRRATLLLAEPSSIDLRFFFSFLLFDADTECMQVGRTSVPTSECTYKGRCSFAGENFLTSLMRRSVVFRLQISMLNHLRMN